MRKVSVALLCCFVFCAVLGYAQSAEQGFQTARIVQFERVPQDTQHPERADQYKMTMRLGDTIYNCHTSGPAATFLNWTMNKELPAQVNGKTMLVKNFDGQIVQLSITGKKTAK